MNYWYNNAVSEKIYSKRKLSECQFDYLKSYTGWAGINCGRPR